MASTFETKTAGVNYPLRCAHAGGRGIARENSLEAIRASLECDIDDLEVDVRKSRDGVLYCHHGSIPFGVLRAQFLHLLNFATIQKLAGPVATLKEVAQLMPAHMGFYMDVKETGVMPDDLRLALAGCAARRTWISSYDRRQMEKLMTLGPRHIYVYNGGMIFWESRMRGETKPDLVINIVLDFIVDYLPASLSRWITEKPRLWLPRWRAFDPELHRFIPFSRIVWVVYDDPRKSGTA